MAMNKLALRTKALVVDLFQVQDYYTCGRFILGSELGINEFRFRAKSLEVDLH